MTSIRIHPVVTLVFLLALLAGAMAWQVTTDLTNSPAPTQQARPKGYPPPPFASL